MKRTMIETHMAGGHRDKPRPRCPICSKPKPYMTATNRPESGVKRFEIPAGRGYCTPAGIR